MGAHYVCTTAEGIADVIARTAPPAEPLDIPDMTSALRVSGRYANQEDPGAQVHEQNLMIRICDPFAFLRLRDDLRREVLSYVVEVTKDVALRRIKAAADECEDPYSEVHDLDLGRSRPVTFAPGGEKFLRKSLAPSAAAAFETLRWHLTTRAVCTAVNGDIEAIVQRSGSTASGSAWLEHLYCRRYVGAISGRVVAAELRARAKLGRRANTTRELYARAAEAFSIQTMYVDDGEKTMMFRPPSNWPAERQRLAKSLLVKARCQRKAGPALAHGRVLTVDEANENMPGDPELLKMLAATSFQSVVASLSEVRLTLVVVGVRVVHRGPQGSSPSDADFDALDSALDTCFGDLATRGEHWTAAWTNVKPYDYDKFQKELEIDESMGDMHDPARPPLTALRDVYAATNLNLNRLQLTCEEDEGKCVSLVDVEIPEGATSSPQIENSFAGDFRFIGPHVAAKCHTGSARYANAILKLSTHISAFRDDSYMLGSCILFLPIVPDVFDAILSCHIPGMN